MAGKNIVILTGGNFSTAALYNALKQQYNITVIVENRVNKKQFLQRRIKKLGYVAVTGQILFQTLIGKFLAIKSRRRINEILEQYQLDLTAIPENVIIRVSSVNDQACIDHLVKINPDVVIVNGTRIIKEKVLNAINVPFINTHTGITPKYRGVHGGYWALVNKDPENCGVTVHLVDKGIDTGSVIHQGMIKPQRNDNFSTYTVLQIGVGIRLMVQTISEYFEGRLVTKQVNLESKIWSHPTIWKYIKHRILDGVK